LHIEAVTAKKEVQELQLEQGMTRPGATTLPGRDFESA